MIAKFGKALLALVLAGKKAIVAVLVGLGALARKLFSRDARSPDDGAPPGANG